MNHPRRAILAATILILTACGSSDDEPLPGELVEVPVGEPAVSTIGTTGGAITSTDGRLTLTFPAGALSADTEISIQELEFEGGRAWALSPDGLQPAVPIAALVTVTEAEVGTVVTETVAGEEFVSMPMLAFFHMRRDAPFTTLAVTPTWRQDTQAIEQAFSLDHFSVVAYIGTGTQGAATRATVPVGAEFGVSMRTDAQFRMIALPFRCADGKIVRKTLNVKLTPGVVDLEDLDKISQVPFDQAILPDDSGRTSFALCEQVGVDGFVAKTQMSFVTSDGAFAGVGIPELAGCFVDEARHDVRRELTVDCTALTCTASDPADISVQSMASPSVDLICVQTGVTPAPGGRPWVRVVFRGPWPPPQNYFSWFARVTLNGASGPLGSYTKQRHDGQEQTLVSGMVTTDNTTFTPEGWGFLLVFPASLAGQITSATIDSGQVSSEGAPMYTDQIVVSPFDATVRAP